MFQVVDIALNSNYGIHFEVADCLSSWVRRGTGDYSFAEKCVRADADLDMCNGFFVTVFQRKASKRPDRKRKAEVEIEANSEVREVHTPIKKKKKKKKSEKQQ